jgi:hypothetical protein
MPASESRRSFYRILSPSAYSFSAFATRSKDTSTYISANRPILGPYPGAFASHHLGQRLGISTISKGHWPIHLAASATTNTGISLTNPYKAISFLSPASKVAARPYPCTGTSCSYEAFGFLWPFIDAIIRANPCAYDGITTMQRLYSSPAIFAHSTVV